MRMIMISLIRFYQRFLSCLKPTSSCRFTPSCSQYFIDALQEWGVICGTGLGIWRILRCNPFGRSGNDPVPINHRRRARQAERENRKNRANQTKQTSHSDQE